MFLWLVDSLFNKVLGEYENYLSFLLKRGEGENLISSYFVFIREGAYSAVLYFYPQTPYDDSTNFKGDSFFAVLFCFVLFSICSQCSGENQRRIRWN